MASKTIDDFLNWAVGPKPNEARMVKTIDEFIDDQNIYFDSLFRNAGLLPTSEDMNTLRLLEETRSLRGKIGEALAEGTLGEGLTDTSPRSKILAAAVEHAVISEGARTFVDSALEAASAMRMRQAQQPGSRGRVVPPPNPGGPG